MRQSLWSAKSDPTLNPVRLTSGKGVLSELSTPSLLGGLMESLIADEQLKPTPKGGYKCPECKGKMTLRTVSGTFAHFYGCTKFPVCKGSRMSDGSLAKRKFRGEHSFFFDEHDWGGLFEGYDY